MRKLFVLLFISLSGILVTQCGQEVAPKNGNDHLIEEAKNFFNTSIKNVVDAPADQQAHTPLQDNPKTAVWEKAHVENMSVGKVVVVPITFQYEMVAKDKTGNAVYASRLSRLLIYRDDQGSLVGEIAVSIPDSVCRSTGGKVFSGLVQVYDWNMKMKRAYYHRDGAINPMRFDQSDGQVDHDRSGAGNQRTKEIIYICNYIYWDVYVGGVYSYTYTQFGGCITINTGGGSGDQGFPPPGEGGGGGEGAPTIFPLIELRSVMFDFTNPCIVAAAGKLPTFDLNIFSNSFFFTDYNNTVKLKIMFGENRSLGDSRPADSWPEHPNNNGIWHVDLNPGFWEQATQPNATQEIAGITILHEIVHGYIYFYKDYFDIAVFNELATHEVMFKEFITAMRDTMMNGFGLSQQDATALALQGLDNVLKKEYDINGNLSSYNQQYNDFALTNYGLSIPEAEAIFDQYLSGAKGTRCF